MKILHFLDLKSYIHISGLFLYLMVVISFVTWVFILGFHLGFLFKSTILYGYVGRGFTSYYFGQGFFTRGQIWAGKVGTVLVSLLAAMGWVFLVFKKRGVMHWFIYFFLFPIFFVGIIVLVHQRRAVRFFCLLCFVNIHDAFE